MTRTSGPTGYLPAFVDVRPARRNLTASRAAAHLGVSVKALRIYERLGLLAPSRTAAGWRTYTPDDLERARRIVSLRALGLGLAEIGGILDGDPRAMDAGLALHAGKLQHQAEHIAATLQEIRSRRDEAFRDRPLASTAATGSAIATVVGFELPWPWGGERFELREAGPLNFITGPLGNGKTRFAMRLAEALPNAVFLGLDRLADGTLPRRLTEDGNLAERVERALAGLAEAGAERSNALATEPDDFADVFWPALRRYDPRWVSHGCLIGAPVDAAKILHRVMTGNFLRPETFRAMLERHDLGGALPDRPWTRCGYGLGLMTGRMDGTGRAIGHSGSGPHSSNAIYHFPDLAAPVTVASFANADDEGPVEFEAVRIAVATQP